ncbi:hypothetical protein [Halobacteriovorax sp.]|uniref:hypothetical protein n=1 Tax=Halobacteriovorax sp. TaxID=2020862 RepID=UPI003AF23688
MKLIALFAILFTANTFASQRNIIGDEVFFSAQGHVGSILEVCTDGENLRTLSPVKYCTGYSKVWVADSGKKSDGHYDYVCNGFETGVLSTAINYTVKVCLEREYTRDSDDRVLGKCLQYGIENRSYELDGTLDVEYTSRGGTNVYRTSELDYSVPACN